MSASEGAPQQDPASQINITTNENYQTAPIQIESQDQDDQESETELEIAEDSLTSRELDDVTTVFRQYETGLRGGCISVKVTKNQKQLLIIIRKAFITRISTELSSHWVSR